MVVDISVRGWIDPRAIVWPERLYQRKIPMTPSGIDPVTFRFVVQRINHCATACPHLSMSETPSFPECPVDSNFCFPSHLQLCVYVTHQFSHHESNEGLATLIHKMCLSLHTGHVQNKTKLLHSAHTVLPVCFVKLLKCLCKICTKFA
jgi:hypothetical protein